MENIILHTNPDTRYFPEVMFDFNKGLCELSGESYMEETYKFYAPLIDWLKKYFAEKKPLVFNFKLSYFNTSTSRTIIEILELFKTYKSTGGSITVNWYYSSEDPDMRDEVQDFIDEVGFDIIILTF